MVKDHINKQSREFGFIKFALKDSVDVAVKQMNETVLSGREIKVEISRRSEPRRQTPGRYMGSSRYGENGSDMRGPPRDSREGGYRLYN